MSVPYNRNNASDHPEQSGYNEGISDNRHRWRVEQKAEYSSPNDAKQQNEEAESDKLVATSTEELAKLPASVAIDVIDEQTMFPNDSGKRKRVIN